MWRRRRRRRDKPGNGANKKKVWELKQINTLMKMSATDSLMMFFSQVTKLLVFIPPQ